MKGLALIFEACASIFVESILDAYERQRRKVDDEELADLADRLEAIQAKRRQSMHRDSN